MTLAEQKQIFAKNLMYLVEQSGKQQKDIAKELGVEYTTFNTWTRGASMPNAAKIQMLADYFNVLKTDLLDSKIEDEENAFEAHAKIMMAKQYLSYVVGVEASKIVSGLAQLNEDGLSELQKRMEEMLCVPRYRRELKPDDREYISVEDGIVTKTDYLGREIED